MARGSGEWRCAELGEERSEEGARGREGTECGVDEALAGAEVPQRQEEGARLAGGGAAVEHQGEGRRRREEPEDIHRLRAAAGELGEERVGGGTILLRGCGGGGEELASGRGFGPGFGRRCWRGGCGRGEADAEERVVRRGVTGWDMAADDGEAAAAGGARRASET